MLRSARFMALVALAVVCLAGASATAMPRFERGYTPGAARTPAPAPVADETEPAPENDAAGSQRTGTQQGLAPQSTPSPTPSSPSPTPRPSSSGSSGGGSGGSGNQEGDGRLVVSSSSSKLLAELGDVVEYRVTVSNPGNEALRDVDVVEQVAPELDVVSVAISDDADDISLGRGPTGEDIVWHVSSLEANESLVFTWKGQAAAPGDLMAINAVTATAAGADPSQDESTTFLGVDREVTTANPKPKPVEKKVVVFGTRVVNAGPPAVAADGSVLPATGSNIAAYIYLGGIFVAAGALVLAIFRSSMRGKRTGASVVIAALLLAACVSGTSDQQAAPDRSTDEQEADKGGAEVGGEPKDQVKGKRIERTEEERQAEEGLTETDVAAPVVTETQAPIVERTRTVETVLVAPEDLPVIALGSKEGDNTTTYDWDLDAREITQAASSVFFDATATSEILTSVDFSSESINVTVTLTNITEDSQLAVSGRLVHVISDASGQIARFESDPIDTTLEPGGEVSADFSYLLPTGGYTATSAFVAS